MTPPPTAVCARWEIFRCAYRFLAESYRVALEELERNTGKKYSRRYIPLMDNGHYQPTEVVSDKIPALLAFFPEIALHVTRPIRWDSDHVVLFDDERLF